MKIYYSKPSMDLQKEAFAEQKNDKNMLDAQSRIVKILLKSKSRKKCILCSNAINGEKFSHRNVEFIICGKCGHIQTRLMPPEGYPWIEYNYCYPSLDRRAYEGRKKRIYEPKLDWITRCLKDMGYSGSRIASSAWTEIGCGAGYFLSCLKDAGIKRYVGLDADKGMVERVGDFVGPGSVKYFKSDISEVFERYPSDIYVAFFVLEHVTNTYRLLNRMKSLPKGTIFVFAVPVFGLSCILEKVFEKSYARVLDSVLHTQLYTSRSIDYAMKLAGYEVVSKWIFGEDSMDLTRFVVNHIAGSYSKKMLKYITMKLIDLQDPLQSLLDKSDMGDQRHIIAVKR